jgi:hypothetical protein
MISENRSSHLAHLIRERLKKTDLIKSNDEMKTLQSIKKGLAQFLKTHDEVDQEARRQISSQKKSIVEGSMEWEVLYSRFYEQELRRKGMSND